MVLPHAQQQGPTLPASPSLFRDLQNCWQEVGQVPAAGHEGGQVPAAPREMMDKVLLAGLGLFWQKGPWCGALCGKPLGQCNDGQVTGCESLVTRRNSDFFMKTCFTVAVIFHFALSSTPCSAPGHQEDQCPFLFV